MKNKLSAPLDSVIDFTHQGRTELPEQGMELDCALLLFSEGAEASARRKQIFADHQSSREAFDLIIRHCVSLAASSGLPVLRPGSMGAVGSGQMRTGPESFAAKLRSAFASAYHSGFEYLIAIGDDCPSITEADLRGARKALGEGRPVLGPARDGGVWLIALSRRQFEDLAWDDLPWCTRDLLAALKQALGQSAPLLLSPKTDIDSSADLIAAVMESEQGLKDALLQLLKNSSFQADETAQIPVSDSDWSQHLLRAPPLAC